MKIDQMNGLGDDLERRVDGEGPNMIRVSGQAFEYQLLLRTNHNCIKDPDFIFAGTIFFKSCTDQVCEARRVYVSLRCSISVLPVTFPNSRRKEEILAVAYNSCSLVGLQVTTNSPKMTISISFYVDTTARF